MELRYCCSVATCSLPSLPLHLRRRSSTLLPPLRLFHSDPKLPKPRFRAGLLRSPAFQDNQGFVSDNVVVAPDHVEQAEVSNEQLGSEYIVSYAASLENYSEGNAPNEAKHYLNQAAFKDEVICTNVEDTVVRSEVDTNEASNGANQVTILLKKLHLKLDSGSYVLFIFGAGGVFALWLSYAIVGAIDSIPLFPKLMELVGLGFTIWFTSKYLFLKESRDELTAKIDDLKEQIIGSLEE